MGGGGSGGWGGEIIPLFVQLAKSKKSVSVVVSDFMCGMWYHHSNTHVGPVCKYIR